MYQIVLEFQRFQSVKACRPKTRQAKVKRKRNREQFKNYSLLPNPYSLSPKTYCLKCP
ncbi:MAG: hypothetical protein LBP59_04390 [Planctomycetaceae bacterium]|nr:hypothetical protein [Planctomycetaceae bacterium]